MPPPIPLSKKLTLRRLVYYIVNTFTLAALHRGAKRWYDMAVVETQTVVLCVNDSCIYEQEDGYP